MSEHDELQEVLNRLSTLSPGREDAPWHPAEALTQFKQHHAYRQDADAPSKRSFNIMSNRRFVVAGLTLVMAMALLMAFPSVRAAASDFLGLFRVQKFAPVSVSPEQMALLGQLSEQGLSPGEFVTVTEPGDPVPVDSLEAAAALTGYQILTLADSDVSAEVYVTSDAAGYLDIDLAGARAIVEAAGADPMLLPDSLDGERVNVHVYKAVQQLLSDGTMLMQTASPDVNYPDDVDPTVLGEALLQVLGSDPATAHRMAQSIDWTSTLLLPIPQDLGSYSEVSIHGITGVALAPFDPNEDPAVIWQKDGMVYMMTGPVLIEDLIAHANRLQ